MTGTLINISAVLVGGTLGLLFGARLPERLKATVVAGLGLFTAAIGIQMFLKTENAIIVLGALLVCKTWEGCSRRASLPALKLLPFPELRQPKGILSAAS